MASSPRTQSQQVDERTPLLRSSSDHTGDNQAVNESAIIEDDDIGTVAAAGSAAIRPEQDLTRPRSYSHSHWLAPDEDGGVEPDETNIDAFKEDGLLAGISRTKFRFIFGGICAGFFVSLSSLLLLSMLSISPRK